MLTGGQVHDSVMMKPALDQLDISKSVILADKAYGSAENRKYISDRGAQYCIPPKEGLHGRGQQDGVEKRVKRS